MAAKAKDGNSGKHVSRGMTSLPSNPRTPTTTTTNTIKRKPKQAPPPSPLEKRVPHYLKPTASSHPDGPKPTRNSVMNSKPADLDQKRSFEKPSSSTLTKSSPAFSSSSSTTRRIRPPRSLSLSPITSASPATKKKKKKEKAGEAIKTKGGTRDPAEPISPIPAEKGEADSSAAEQGEAESSVWSVEEESSEIESRGVPSDILNPEGGRDQVDGATEEETVQELPAAEEGDRDGDREGEDEGVGKSIEMLRAEGGGIRDEEQGREMKAEERERKKETITVYNDVIEERSQLLEEKKNKVKALVGAFETVISLQEPDS